MAAEVNTHDAHPTSQHKLIPKGPYAYARHLDPLYQLDRAALSAVGSALRPYDRWLLGPSLIHSTMLTVQRSPISHSAQQKSCADIRPISPATVVLRLNAPLCLRLLHTATPPPI